MVPRTLELHPSTLKRLVRLSKEAERDGSYRVAKRLQAVVMNAEGYSSGEIARILKSPRSKTSEWLRRYEEDGVDGLLEGHRSGRPTGSWMKSNAASLEIFSTAARRHTAWTPGFGRRR